MRSRTKRFVGLMMAATMTVSTVLSAFGTTVSAAESDMVKMQGITANTVFENYVTTEGTKLMDGDEELKFVSLNYPQATSDTPWEQKNAVKTIQTMGGNVTRTYTIPVTNGSNSGKAYVTGVDSDGNLTFDEAALNALDQLLAYCNEYGIRVIVPLVDHWHWIGGMDGYVWLANDKSDSYKPSSSSFQSWAWEFYSDEKCIDYFEQMIAHLMDRTNTVTGVKYKDDPAVLCWETGNEVGGNQTNQKTYDDILTAWNNEITGFIKEQGVKQLVLDGRMSTTEQSRTNNPADILGAHYYEGNYATRCAEDTKDAHEAGYPFILGEFGAKIKDSDVIPVFQAGVENNTNGIMMWSLRAHKDGYGYYFHDEDGYWASYHWPGFPSGDYYGETEILRAIYAYALIANGIAPDYATAKNLPIPAPETEEAPLLYDITTIGDIKWRGVVGGAWYEIQRADGVVAAGADEAVWTTIADEDDYVYDSGRNWEDKAHDCIAGYHDETAITGETYSYRLRACNESGAGSWSNIVTVNDAKHIVNDELDLIAVSSTDANPTEIRRVYSYDHSANIELSSSSIVNKSEEYGYIGYAAKIPVQNVKIKALSELAQEAEPLVYVSQDDITYVPVETEHTAGTAEYTVNNVSAETKYYYTRVYLAGSSQCKLDAIELEYVNDGASYIGDSTGAAISKNVMIQDNTFGEGAEPYYVTKSANLAIITEDGKTGLASSDGESASLIYKTGDDINAYRLIAYEKADAKLGVEYSYDGVSFGAAAVLESEAAGDYTCNVYGNLNVTGRVRVIRITYPKAAAGNLILQSAELSSGTKSIPLALHSPDNILEDGEYYFGDVSSLSEQYVITKKGNSVEYAKSIGHKNMTAYDSMYAWVKGDGSSNTIQMAFTDDEGNYWTSEPYSLSDTTGKMVKFSFDSFTSEDVTGNMDTSDITEFAVLISGTDITELDDEVNYITNGDFVETEAEWPNLPTGFIYAYEGGDGWSPLKGENEMFVGYADAAYTFSVKQQVSGLPDGIYKLSADITMLNADTINSMILKAGEKETDVTAQLVAETAVSVSLTDIRVTDGTVEVSIAGDMKAKGIKLDNLQLVKTGDIESENYITNGDFVETEAEWPNLPTGFTYAYEGGDGWSPLKGENEMFVGYADAAYTFSAKQQVSGLPDGIYKLSADITMLNADTINSMILKAGEKETDVTAQLVAETAVSVSLTDIRVTDGTVEVSIAGDMKAKGIKLDNLQLVKTGDIESENFGAVGLDKSNSYTGNYGVSYHYTLGATESVIYADCIYVSSSTKVDDFEEYSGSTNLLKGKYNVNSNGGLFELSLDSMNKSEGSYGLKAEYNYNGKGYAGATKNMDLLNLAGYDGFMMWCNSDGSGNQLKLQVETDVSTFSYTGNLTAKGAMVMYLPFSDFAEEAWAGSGHELDYTQNLKSVSLYTNQDGSVTSGILYFDDIKGANYVEALESQTAVTLDAPTTEIITSFPYTFSGTAEYVSSVALTIGDKCVNVPVDANGAWSYEFTAADGVLNAENIAIKAGFYYPNGKVVKETEGKTITLNVEGNEPEPTLEAIWNWNFGTDGVEGWSFEGFTPKVEENNLVAWSQTEYQAVFSYTLSDVPNGTYTLGNDIKVKSNMNNVQMALKTAQEEIKSNPIDTEDTMSIDVRLGKNIHVTDNQLTILYYVSAPTDANGATFAVNNLALYQIEADPIAETNYVINGEFVETETEWPNLPTGFTYAYEGGDGWSPIKGENEMLVGYADAAYTFSVKQQVSGLPEGIYKLSADITMLNADTINSMILKAGEKEADVVSQLVAETAVSVNLTEIRVTDGAVEISIAGDMKAKGMKLDNLKLVKTGNVTPETPADPENPTDPEKPADPTDQTEPENPGTSENPIEPEAQTPAVQKENKITGVSSSYTKIIGGKAFTLKAKGNGTITYTSSDKKVVTVNKSGKVTIKGIGKATITIKAAGNANYKSAAKKITIKITPKKVSLKSVKSAKKSTITVQWKRDTKASGYQIRYAANAGMKKAATVTIKKNQITKKTINKLKAGKKYYVQVRSYKTVKGTKIYGNWSTKKVVRAAK